MEQCAGRGFSVCELREQRTNCPKRNGTKAPGSSASMCFVRSRNARRNRKSPKRNGANSSSNFIAGLRQGYAVHVFCNNDGERQRFDEILAENTGVPDPDLQTMPD